MTLMYKLFGIPRNSAELKDKIDRKIGKLKEKVKIKGEKVDITQQIDAYSVEGVTHYNCYLKMNSKGVFGSVNVPVTGSSYYDHLENYPEVRKRKNNDCADVYELALNFAERFTREGLEVLIDGKSLAEIRDIIPQIRNREVPQHTIMIPSYPSLAF